MTLAASAPTQPAELVSEARLSRKYARQSRSPHVDEQTYLPREDGSASPSKCPSARPDVGGSHRGPAKTKGNVTTDIGYYCTEHFAKVRYIVNWVNCVTTNGVTMGAGANALLPRFRSGQITVTDGSSRAMVPTAEVALATATQVIGCTTVVAPRVPTAPKRNDLTSS